MYKYLLLAGFFLSFSLRSQTPKKDSVEVDGEEINWDTTKYRKYNLVLIVGVYQQHRNFNNEFIQYINKDTSGLSEHIYSAESQQITGLSLNYDKFAISFGTRSTPAGSGGKGYTKTFNIGINIGDNRWLFETYYRRFKGFYNKNTGNFDSTFKISGQYYLQPGLLSSLFMNRIMYFTNYKKYSFKSGFGCDYRQLKSAATWILGGSFSVYNLKNDSSIFPVQARPLYNDYGNMQGFRSSNFSINVGAAATIVLFKAWFVTGYFTVGPEQQWRNYNLGNGYRNLSYISWSGTGRASIGVNLKKFYLLTSITNDYNLYNCPGIIDFSSKSITGNFTFGWRFHASTPEFYKKIQQTKIYKFF